MVVLSLGIGCLRSIVCRLGSVRWYAVQSMIFDNDDAVPPRCFAQQLLDCLRI
jgi:hypothetical protein